MFDVPLHLDLKIETCFVEIELRGGWEGGVGGGAQKARFMLGLIWAKVA